MDNLITKCCFISSETHRDIIIHKNPVNDEINVFAFLELNYKTENTPYHEFVGMDITEEIRLLNDQSFDVNVFEVRLETKMKVTIRETSDHWMWIKATKMQ